ncbi:mitogen-activated protein kinase kinase kinase 5-like isoform X2 [Bidens hawaiensis]|uniref:mitogen-activated protein kinase kinase kinase 5-like isoform X2 n=1 Tax=Bidens hawaiensis TaxID=980011 RepID=UPI00404B13C8
MSKFFSRRRFHLSSPAKLIPTFSSTSNSNYDNNSSSKSSLGDYSINGGLLLSPQTNKKLTRQRKLRHLTLEDYCAPEEDVRGVSKSLPSSPISGSKSPQHWSSSAVPQPLPLPVDDLRLPGEGYSGGNGRSRSDRHGMNAKCGGVPISSKPSTYARRKGYGYPQDINGDKVHKDIRLHVPARSAPTTTFTSPTLSPKFSTVDIFDSALAGTREFHMLPPSDASTRRSSQLHSPPLQSPYLINRPESNNNNTNVHPLPLPPSRPVSRHQSLDKSDGKSIKGQWQKGKLLGHGSFGTVYEATNRETGSLCAMKVVDIIPDDPKSSECLRQLEQEIKVL